MKKSQISVLGHRFGIRTWALEINPMLLKRKQLLLINFIYGNFFPSIDMGILYQDDLEPSENMTVDQAYEVSVKKLDTRVVTKFHVCHKTFKTMFLDKGLSPKWQTWNNDSKKYVDV